MKLLAGKDLRPMADEYQIPFGRMATKTKAGPDWSSNANLGLPQTRGRNPTWRLGIEGCAATAGA